MSTATSLAKLSSLSTQTLSLLLERQRLQTLPSFSSPPTSTSNLSSPTPPPTQSQLHLPQITRNLLQLRSGIIELQNQDTKAGQDNVNATLLGLSNQYERMRTMLGDDCSNELESLQSSLPPPPPPPPKDTRSEHHDDPIYPPYTDDPDLEAQDSGTMLQTQRQLMDEQDTHLDLLSHSINRQHHISLQINDELDVHTGLLEELDTDLDRTGSRLAGARRGLDRVARGAKENGSTVTIGVLILVLLILIIVFKT